jgi:hypothetical protein
MTNLQEKNHGGIHENQENFEKYQTLTNHRKAR